MGWSDWQNWAIGASIVLFFGGTIAADILDDRCEAHPDETLPVCGTPEGLVKAIATTMPDMEPVAALDHQGMTVELWQDPDPPGSFAIMWHNSEDPEHAVSCLVALEVGLLEG